MPASERRVYLDYNASAPLRQCARTEMERAWDQAPGNPSSPHAEGRCARGLLDDARHRVAALVGATADQVVFTSGGTEAMNAVIRGVVAKRGAATRARVIAAATDHACVLETLAVLAAEGCETVLLPVDPGGLIDLDALRDALASGAACVATHWVNNETGVVQDVDTIADLCRAAGVPLLLDAVQAAGKVPIDFAPCAAGALAISAHKLGGPQGVGALVLDADLAWQPLVRGGHQEYDRRAGTEPVPAAVGFGAAAAAAARELETYAPQVGPLRDALRDRLRALVPRVVVHGEGAPRVANTLNLRFPGWRGELVAQRLDLEGIAVGTGAACAAGAAAPSHVLSAMGVEPGAAGEAVRFSLGFATTEADVQSVVAVVDRLSSEWGPGG